MSQRILLVDDEEDIRDSFSTVLTKEGFQVITANDGLHAQEILGKEQPFDIVVSDMRMPKANGISILKWINSNKPSQKILFFTGFADSEEVKAAYELGVKSFLSKPIAPKDFVAAVKKSIAETSDAPSGSPDSVSAADGDHYARIPIEEFISGKTISYPVYMRMNDGKFLKIAHTGEDLTPERVVKMREKGTNEFWLSSEDFKKYQEFSRKILNAVVSSNKFSNEKKLQVIRSACSVASENLKVTGVTPDSLKEAEGIFDLTLNAGLTGSDVSNSLFMQIGTPEQANFAHSSMCGMLVALMTKVMDWSSKKNIMAVTMAAFLHDVGLASLPQELQDKKYDDMTDDEKKQYEQHPLLASGILKDSGVVTDDLIRSIEQHHEDVRGCGYPKKISRGEIFPMSRLIFLVDHFCDELMLFPPNERKNAGDILNSLLISQRGAFDQNAAMALTLVLTAKSLDQARISFKRAVS